MILKVLTTVVMLCTFVYVAGNDASATPFFENGQFTINGIEWCQENRQLYELLGDKFFEHHKHSLESRVCVSLYKDQLWNYDGQDRMQKLVEKSRYYSQLEISESLDESKTGVIDTTPAASRDETLLRGITEDGQVTVQLIAAKPTASIPMQINISFQNKTHSLISNVNYSIEATQQGNRIMFKDNGYSENGLVTLSTLPLQSDQKVDINITINGIGLPEDKHDWTVPKGQVIGFTVIPEFGHFVILIFFISVMAMTIITKTNELF